MIAVTEVGSCVEIVNLAPVIGRESFARGSATVRLFAHVVYIEPALRHGFVEHGKPAFIQRRRRLLPPPHVAVALAALGRERDRHAVEQAVGVERGSERHGHVVDNVRARVHLQHGEVAVGREHVLDLVQHHAHVRHVVQGIAGQHVLELVRPFAGHHVRVHLLEFEVLQLLVGRVLLALVDGVLADVDGDEARLSEVLGKEDGGPAFPAADIQDADPGFWRWTTKEKGHSELHRPQKEVDIFIRCEAIRMQ